MKTRGASSLACLILGLFLFGPVDAAERPNLDLNVRCSKTDYGSSTRDPNSSGEGRWRYDFIVLLTNSSADPVVVLKGGKEISYGTTREKDYTEFTLSYAWEIEQFGARIVVPSKSELGLARLNEGESARLHIAIRSPFEYDERHMTFRYSIGKRLAARFGTWQGDVNVPVEFIQSM